MTKATTIIDIQDDPDPEPIPSTIVVEQPPLPLQLPNLLTTAPHQTTTLEQMQPDQTTRESPKPSSEIPNPDPKVSEKSTMLDVLNPSMQEQKPESSTQEEATRSREEPEADRTQQITSPPKGEDAQEIMMHDAEVLEDTEIPDAPNEPDSTMDRIRQLGKCKWSKSSRTPNNVQT
jgi:hypothetical protein